MKGRHVVFFIVGIFFGIVMFKSEVVSWFRIHEMFRFESIHMYGIIGTAVVFSALMFMILKKINFKNVDGNPIKYDPLNFNIKRHIIAGTIFGLGWALLGACPGPMYVLLGSGYGIFLVVIPSAVAGAYLYGLVRDKLPH
jgi:uncharacterized membrane protein YedE/YeeE